jgi:alcohol dehydrogenase class IV
MYASRYMQNEYMGEKSVSFLKGILKENSAKRIFLVTGKQSYYNPVIQAKLQGIFNGFEIVHYSGMQSIPTAEDIRNGVSLFFDSSPDIVVAIGGGSIIDIAKTVNACAAQNGTKLEQIIKNNSIQNKGKSLIAVPTTAGSGSEATHFAVVYINGIKYSLRHPSIRPDYVIIDPELTYTLPSRTTAITGIDALAQAIESYWCVNSTPESQDYARQAISLIMQNLHIAVHSPTPDSRKKMMRAANLAGKAINITQTTAPHAISYPITSRFNIPHGHAVGLTLPLILEYNSKATVADILDNRGTDYVIRTINEIVSLLNARDAEDAKQILTRLMESCGLQTKLSQIGIEKSGIMLIVDEGFNPDRIKNNPRLITRDALEQILLSIA